ncbi:MAG TPA: serine/threonine-protein kinase [Burkholderiaceae bacterium]|nr:serine/threonine-protein kinase [Burkholderiaceae bacterium]
MSLPPDDEPTIAPIRSTDGGRSGSLASEPGSGNALPPGTHLGEFEITGLVGVGGFGIVYLAYDHVLERKVAVKEYMPAALATRADSSTVIVRSARQEEAFQAGLRSFINEAKLLARFDHPSLVKVYRFWDANGTAYMVMPFYEGVTLKATLKALPRPPDEAWLKNLLRPLLDALALLHNDHVYHRDIAPDNILMLEGAPLEDAQPLLLDFGAARRVIGDLTHDLTAILKPGYAPVEQYADVASMKQGPWTDIYALASVVYFAITGKAPEPSVARLINDPMVPLATSAAGRYSAQFLRGIDKALSVKPQERPQSIAELRTWLGLDEGPVTVRAPAPPPDSQADLVTVAAPARAAPAPAARPSTRTPPRVPSHAASSARKRWSGPIAALLVVVVIAIAAAMYFMSSPQPQPPRTAEPVAAPPAAPVRAVEKQPATEQAAPAPVAPKPIPVEPAEPTPPKSSEKPTPSVVESSPAGKNTKRNAGGSTKSECVEILQRVSLGEPLTQAEQATLKEHCR